MIMKSFAQQLAHQRHLLLKGRKGDRVILFKRMIYLLKSLNVINEKSSVEDLTSDLILKMCKNR
jgi:hypothetical protein